MTDFENTPLKDKGRTIRYHDGKPVLYKHFLNDLPDPEHERATAKTLKTTMIDLFLRYGTPISDSANISKERIEKRRKELQELGTLK